MSQPVPYGAVIYAKDYRALAKFYERVAGVKRCDGIAPRATCSSYKRLHCELMRPSPLRRMVSNSQRAPSFVISSTFRHGALPDAIT